MDQSFWSDPLVIEASRHYVCARLATYEDKTEGAFLADIYRGRSGELENTVFVILSHDGKRRLSSAGRSPSMVFGGSPGWEGTVLALEMDRVLKSYKSKKTKPTSGTASLPIAKDVRRAVNISACDRLPLVISMGLNKKQTQTLASIAWKEPYIGRFNWGVANQASELESIGIKKPTTGIWVLQPDTYGLKVEVIARVEADSKTKPIEEALAKALAGKRPAEKNMRRHVNRGNATGKRWETEIPVTDPGIPPSRGGRPGRGN
ncbi:MAG: hypothetical protein AAEJ04_04795 [Planctomycetota bacterium]